MRVIGRKAASVFALALLAAGAGGANAQAQSASPAPSAARGKVLFLRCASCHAVTPDAAAKIGPNLAGVVGRQGGALPGYRYSTAMKAKAPVWTEAALDQWLTEPAKLVPGTSMAFAGLPSAPDRAAVIAYLKTLR